MERRRGEEERKGNETYTDYSPIWQLTVEDHQLKVPVLQL